MEKFDFDETLRKGLEIAEQIGKRVGTFKCEEKIETYYNDFADKFKSKKIDIGLKPFGDLIGDIYTISTDPKIPKDAIKHYCGYNNYKELPYELPATLELLYCDNNMLKTLPKLPSNLEILQCCENCLVELPELPPKFKELNCEFNYLTELPELPECIEKLWCFCNHIKYLSPSNCQVIKNLNLKPKVERRPRFTIGNNPVYEGFDSLDAFVDSL